MNGEIRDKNSEKLVNACASSNIETFSPTNATTRLHGLHWAKLETQIVYRCMNEIFRRFAEYVKKGGADGALGHGLVMTKLRLKLRKCRMFAKSVL